MITLNIGEPVKHVELPIGNGMSIPVAEAAYLFRGWAAEHAPQINEAFTQADIELALDDRGWLIGGKRMAGELDPLSRQVQVNKSRYYWLRDPLIKQAVRLWTDYAFGAEAMSWDSEEEQTKSDIDAFMENRLNRRICSRYGQRRMSNRLLIDGEIFFGVFKDGTIRNFDPLQISDIVTDPDDEDTVVAYKREITSRAGLPKKTLYYKPWDYPEDTPPPKGLGEIQPYQSGTAPTIDNIKWEDDSVMYHLAFDAFEKRGTTLISACSDWTREHRNFMTARVALTQALSRFAWDLTVKGGQRAVNDLRSKMESTYAQTGLQGGVEHQPSNAPGGSWIANEGVAMKATPRTTGASDASSDANNLKLMVSAGTGIMLHYFGDPSTGNLATATAMELPMLKMFQSYQQTWKDAWRDIWSIVLDEDPTKKLAVVKQDMPEIIEEDLQPLAAAVTAVTTIFPEAKVPSLLRRCLSSIGVDNLDEVMLEIEDNKEVMDANVAAGKNPDGSDKIDPLTMAKANAINSGAPDGGNADPNADATESALLRRLDLLLEALGGRDILEYDDSEARDDHGMWTAGGTKNYIGSHKADAAKGTAYGSKNLMTDQHLVNTYERGGERITVDHSVRRGKVNILSNKRGESTKTPLSVKDAQSKLEAKGIKHDFSHSGTDYERFTKGHV